MLVALVIGALGCAHHHGAFRSGHGEHRWRSPIIEALDVNDDGIIDSNEMANASAALLRLDKNQDGQLDYDEIHWAKEHVIVEEPEPVVQVLDVNHDDVIDAQEIANAPAALKKLDKNGDGQLTSDEYAPAPPANPHGHGSETGPNDGEHRHHHRHGAPDSTAPPGSAPGY